MTDDQILTLDELLERTERRVTLPRLSKELGGPRTIKVRRISWSEYLSLLPPPPPGFEEWPEGERAARELAWLEALPEGQRDARRVVMRDVSYRVVALAALEPPLSVEQARRLGNDAMDASLEVLRFSGIVPTPTPAPAEPAPTSEPSAAA